MPRAATTLPDVSGAGNLLRCPQKPHKKRQWDRTCVSKVGCPSCHQKTGDPCMTGSGGKMLIPHVARESAVGSAYIHNKIEDILRRAEARQEAP